MPRGVKNPPATVDGPPGPLALEIRVNDKIVCLQRVHSYEIDQQDATLTVTGVLKLPAQPVAEPVAEAAAVGDGDTGVDA